MEFHHGQMYSRGQSCNSVGPPANIYTSVKHIPRSSEVGLCLYPATPGRHITSREIMWAIKSTGQKAIFPGWLPRTSTHHPLPRLLYSFCICPTGRHLRSLRTAYLPSEMFLSSILNALFPHIANTYGTHSAWSV